MSTIVITIDSSRTKQTIKDTIPWGSTLGKEGINALANELVAIGSGAQDAAVTFAIGASDPVRASGTLTVVFASLNAADTVTVAGQTLTCVTTAPAANQFQKVTDGPTTATNLAAAINAASTSAARVSASASDSVVTVRAHNAGTAGNLIALASSGAGVTVSGANLASGAGGPDEAPISFSFGK